MPILSMTKIYSITYLILAMLYLKLRCFILVHFHYVNLFLHFLFSGAQYRARAHFCSCEKPAVTLIRNGLFPASPVNPTIGFEFQFLELMRLMVFEAHVPLNKFCTVMSMISKPYHRTTHLVSTYRINMYTDM